MGVCTEQRPELKQAHGSLAACWLYDKEMQ